MYLVQHSVAFNRDYERLRTVQQCVICRNSAPRTEERERDRVRPDDDCEKERTSIWRGEEEEESSTKRSVGFRAGEREKPFFSDKEASNTFTHNWILRTRARATSLLPPSSSTL